MLVGKAVTEFDRRASKRKNYNPHALAHYDAALQRVRSYMSAGHDLRLVILNCFLGRLCDTCLRACELPLMTTDEAKYGSFKRLPELSE